MDFYSFWMDVLRTQGVSVCLIAVGIYVYLVHVLPEWKNNNKARIKQHDDLVQLLKDKDQDHKAESREIASIQLAERERMELAHREDMREQGKTFVGMIDSVTSSLRRLGRDVNRNTAITLASAVEQGANKRAIKDRADRLETRDEDEDTIYQAKVTG